MYIILGKERSKLKASKLNKVTPARTETLTVHSLLYFYANWVAPTNGVQMFPYPDTLTSVLHFCLLFTSFEIPSQGSSSSHYTSYNSIIPVLVSWYFGSWRSRSWARATWFGISYRVPWACSWFVFCFRALKTLKSLSKKGLWEKHDNTNQHPDFFFFFLSLVN